MKNTLLLIEDEQKTGEILKQALESEDIDVTWTLDGKSALEQMERGKFDLIILDLKLPEISGDEVLEGIRSIDPYVEVIVYTNYQDPPVMKRLINLGVEGYINKGADADLWDTVEKVKARLAPSNIPGLHSTLILLRNYKLEPKHPFIFLKSRPWKSIPCWASIAEERLNKTNDVRDKSLSTAKLPSVQISGDFPEEKSCDSRSFATPKK
jgi:CheY-like chemotaxis protein